MTIEMFFINRYSSVIGLVTRKFFLSYELLKIFNILEVLGLPDPGSILERERPLLRLWVQSTAAFGSSKAPGQP